MEIEAEAINTIVLMAGATYLTRTMGLWIMNRIQITDRIKKALNVLPGTILVSLVAPSVLSSGIADGIAGLITAAVALKTKSLVLSMLVGVTCVWIFRHSLAQVGL